MASYLRPRRGKKATATSQLTASNPLKRGEIFFEVPDTGVGTGKGKIKMGDGTTAYASLPYFMEQPTVDYTNAVVAWTNTTAASSDPYTDNATYVRNIIPSASLKTIFTNLKKLLLNYNSQLTTLNNDLGILTTDNNNTNPLIKVYSKSITTKVTGGSGNVITVDFSSCSGITGYTALSLMVVQNNDSGVLSLNRIYLNGHTATIGICAPSNWSSSTSLSVTFSIRVAFIRLQYMNIIW